MHRFSRRRRLAWEPLEDRRLLATYIVNSADGGANDGDPADARCDTGNAESGFTGICTLRAAVTQSNANPGTDNIQFNIPSAGVPRIDLGNSLTVGSQVHIDGRTQPGAGTVQIGSTVTVLSFIFGSDGSSVRGLTINNSTSGISSTAKDITIAGNKFGTDPTGTISMPIANTAIVLGGANNTVGGAGPEDQNLIASSGTGVYVVTPAVGNTIINNVIGTDISGTVPLTNDVAGVFVNYAAGTTIRNNLISGNAVGIQVFGNTATSTLIQENAIGTDPTGLVSDPDGIPGNDDDLGNGKGIFVNDAPAVQILDNVVAGSNGVGTDFGHGIHFANSNASDAVVRGNRIGVNTLGTGMLPNSGDGVLIEAASRISVGGGSSTDRNIISGNGGDGVTIYGTSNSTASGNVVAGNYIGTDASGTQDFGNTFRGVHIDVMATENVVGGNSPGERNLISGNDADGVIIAFPTATDNIVKGNFIGTDIDGESALGNEGAGVFLFNARDNLVGQSSGTGGFVRNVISANGSGVRIEGSDATGNVIAGNYIGTELDGLVALPNDEDGILVINGSENQIGDLFALGPEHANFPGNVIAAIRSGIRIEGADAKRNQVLSNLVGVNTTGVVAFDSSAAVGLHILEARQNYIGVDAVGSAGGGNTLSNSLVGLQIENSVSAGSGSIGNYVGGNFIGTDFEGELSDPPVELGNVLSGIVIDDATDNYIGGQPTGTAALPGNVIAGNGSTGVEIIGASRANVIQGNSIHTNEYLGIDLANDDVTGADQHDQDDGPNRLQNAPFVVPVIREGGKLEFAGSLHSMPRNTFRIEFFANDEADPSGHGEGKTFLGGLDDVPTDEEGNAVFTFSPSSVPEAGFITATATDASGNTSEFSCATPVSGIETDGHVFGVTSTFDDGGDTLRQAILAANAHEGRDTIVFCLHGEETYSIQPSEALPTITDPVIIDGFSFTNTIANTLPREQGTNAQLTIELDGSQAGNDAHGLHITAGNSTVRGLAVHGFSGSGIYLDGGSSNTIASMFLGTTIDGSLAQANGQDGITIESSPSNTIGGFLDADRNLISGNLGAGVAVLGADSQHNIVDGNLIGTNASGVAAMGNGSGVSIVNAASNTIGGEGNLISGNGTDGVYLSGATDNVLLRNYIGTNAAGDMPLGNLRGIRILESNLNVVGGNLAGTQNAGNLISGNQETGVVISGVGAIGNRIERNLIGTNAEGTQAIPNEFDGISIGGGASQTIVGGPGPEFGNVISGNGGDGVRIRGLTAFPSNENQVTANWIGTNAAGNAALPNNQNGIQIGPNASGNIVGGYSMPLRNVVSGNLMVGVRIEGDASQSGQDTSNNQLLGNYIGALSDGVNAAGNQIGIEIVSASANFIGDDNEHAGNLISGNATIGIRIQGTQPEDATGNEIRGNLIGTQADGENELGNGTHGVFIAAANGNLIGGHTAPPSEECSQACNIIAFNGKEHPDGSQKGHGIVVEADAAATRGLGNTIQRNSIHSNYGRGIDLGNDSFTLNDVTPNHGDPDSGANHLQDYPVVTRVVVNGTDPNDDDPDNPLPALGDKYRIYWALNSTPLTTFTVEFFANEDPDPNGFGEGQQFLAAYTVATNSKGNVFSARDADQQLRLSSDGRAFYIDLPKSALFVSATATDESTGSTSEFSMVDLDADAIADAFESQNTDHDGDGEIEEWEQGTIDFNEDGTSDQVGALFLPGAHPFHKDLFVEVDVMGNAGISQPSQADLNEVANGRGNQGDGFANAPQMLVQNPDGTNGIKLHALISDTNLATTVFTDSNPNDNDSFPDGWNEYDALKQQHWGDADERSPNPNSQNILAAKRLFYRYTIFGSTRANGNTVSGLAELPYASEGPFGGNDFQTTLGGWNTPGGTQAQQQGTFMHELGHILGIGHGGDVADGVNDKPNYYSTMNYMWQTPSNYSGWRLDYSRADFGDLDELSLNEADGVFTTNDPSQLSNALAAGQGASFLVQGPRVNRFAVDNFPPGGDIDSYPTQAATTQLYYALLYISQRTVGTQLYDLGADTDPPPLSAQDIADAAQAASNLIQAMTQTIAGSTTALPYDWSRLLVGDEPIQISELQMSLPALAAATDDGDLFTPGSGSPPAPPDNEEVDIANRDINGDGQISVLAGHEDWSKIRFYFLESIDGSADGIHTNYEVDEREYEHEHEIAYDFGDAPSKSESYAYPTLLSENGARHAVVGLRNPILGRSIDLEADGQPDLEALGDDSQDGIQLSNTVAQDDEDGVRFTSPLVPGQQASIAVEVQLPENILDEAKLDAWIDFNGDGDWDDNGEQIFVSQVVTDGVNELLFNVPASAGDGKTYARFRLSSDGGLSFAGPAEDGEVEDYRLEIVDRVGDIENAYFSSGALSKVPILEYQIHQAGITEFEVGFFVSDKSQLDSSAVEVGQRIVLNEPSQTNVGVHAVEIDQEAVLQALYDSASRYVFAVVDPSDAVAEFDESNNVRAFAGILGPRDIERTALLRGLLDARNRLGVTENAQDLHLQLNEVAATVPKDDVGRVLVLAGTEDDLIELNADIPFTLFAGPGRDTLEIGPASMEVDLSGDSASTVIREVEVIDVFGGGPQVVTIDPATLADLFDTSQFPPLLRRGDGVVFNFRGDWGVLPPEFINGQSHHVIVSNGTRMEITDNTPWRNPVLNTDVNRDGFLTPPDALFVVNTLNLLGSRELLSPSSALLLAFLYFDSNGDNFVSPIDVLLIINAINLLIGGGEGEAVDDVRAYPESGVAWQGVALGPFADGGAVHSVRRQRPWWTSDEGAHATNADLAVLLLTDEPINQDSHVDSFLPLPSLPQRVDAQTDKEADFGGQLFDLGFLDFDQS